MINDTQDTNLLPSPIDQDATTGQQAVKPISPTSIVSPFDSEPLKFNEELTREPEPSSMRAASRVLDANIGVDPYGFWDAVDRRHDYNIATSGFADSEFVKDTGLRKDLNREGLTSGFLSSSESTYFKTMGDFQDFFKSIGVDLGDSLTNHTKAYTAGLTQTNEGGFLENIRENPWGTIGNSIGQVVTQAGIMAIPSIVVATIAPELGLAVMIDKALKIASTGQRVIAGVAGAAPTIQKVGYGVRSMYLAQAVAARQFMMLPMQSTYVAMTHSVYTDELIKASGGGMSYGKAATIALARSYGEALLESFSVGGRLINSWTRKQLLDKQGELTAALLKNMTGGALKKDGVDVLETLGQKLMGGLSHSVISGKTFGAHYLQSVINDPAQEAIQQLYGQAVNSIALDSDQFNAKEVADAFLTMIPFSALSGIFHANIATRKSMMEHAKTPVTADTMKKLKEAMKPEEYERLIERPFQRFATTFMTQHAANVKAGTGALHSVTPEILMSVLDTFKGMAIQLMITSQGKTTPERIFGRLLPVLTSINAQQMQEMHTTIGELYAAEAIQDPAERAEAVKNANAKFHEQAKLNGIDKAIDDIAAKQRLDDYEYLAKMSEADALFTERNKVNTSADALTNLKTLLPPSDGTLQPRSQMEDVLGSILGQEFVATLFSLDVKDTGAMFQLIKKSFPDMPDDLIGRVIAEAAGNPASAANVLADLVARRNMNPADLALESISAEMYESLGKLGYTVTELQELSMEEIKAIVASKTVNPASVTPEASTAKAEGESAPAEGAPSIKASRTKKIGRTKQHIHPGSVPENKMGEIAEVIVAELKLLNKDLFWEKSKAQEIIDIIVKSGKSELIDLMPFKQFHTADLAAINAKIDALITVREIEDVTKLRDGTIPVVGAKGKLIAITSPVEMGKNPEIKIIEATLRRMRAASLKISHTSSEARALSALIKYTIENSIFKLSQTLRDKLASPIELAAMRDGLDKALSEDAKDEIISKFSYSVFVNELVGHLTRGRRDANRQGIPAIISARNYVLPKDATDQEKNDRDARLEADVEAELSVILPKMEAAITAWEDLTASDSEYLSSIKGKMETVTEAHVKVNGIIRKATEEEDKDDSIQKIPVPVTRMVTRRRYDDTLVTSKFQEKMSILMQETFFNSLAQVAKIPKVLSKGNALVKDPITGQLTIVAQLSGGEITTDADGKKIAQIVGKTSKLNAGGDTQTVQQDLQHAIIANPNRMAMYLALFSDAEITEDNFIEELVMKRMGWGKMGEAGSISARLMDMARTELGKTSTFAIDATTGTFTAMKKAGEEGMTVTLGEIRATQKRLADDPDSTEAYQEQADNAPPMGLEAKEGESADDKKIITYKDITEIEAFNVENSQVRDGEAERLANIGMDTQVGMLAIRRLLQNPALTEGKSAYELRIIEALRPLFGITGDKFGQSVIEWMQTSAVRRLVRSFVVRRGKKTRATAEKIESETPATEVTTAEERRSLFSDNPKYRFLERAAAALRNNAIIKSRTAVDKIAEEIEVLKVRRDFIKSNIDPQAKGIRSRTLRPARVKSLEAQIKSLEDQLVIEQKASGQPMRAVTRTVPLRRSAAAIRAFISDIFTVEELNAEVAIVRQELESIEAKRRSDAENANIEFNTPEALRDGDTIAKPEGVVLEGFRPRGPTLADVRAKAREAKITATRSSEIHASAEAQQVFGLQYSKQVNEEEAPNNIIILLNDATPETVMHEFMHHLMVEGVMPKEYQDLLRGVYGGDEEAIADAMTAYLRIQGGDIDFTNHPELEPAVKWVRSAAGIMGMSINGLLTPEASQFFDVLIKGQGDFVPGGVASAVKVALTSMLNSNAALTPVVNTEIDLGLGSASSPTSFGKLISTLGEKVNVGIFPANSLSELLALVGLGTIDGNASKQSVDAPATVLTKHGKVTDVFIDAEKVGPLLIKIMLSKLEASGIDLKKIHVVYSGGKAIDATNLDRTLSEEDAATTDVVLGAVPENAATRKWMSDPAKAISHIASRTIASIIFNLKAPALPWALTRQDNVVKNKGGVTIGFSGGKLAYKQSKSGTSRIVSEPTTIHVLIDSNVVPPAEIAKALDISGANVEVITKDGSIVPLAQYAGENKIVAVPTVKASATWPIDKDVAIHASSPSKTATDISKKLPYNDSMKLSDLMTAETSELYGVDDVSISMVNGTEAEVVYNPETSSILVTVTADLTDTQKARLIDHGISLANWAVNSDSRAESSVKLFEEYNKIGLVTTSDFLRSHPKASFWSEDNPIIRASMEGKTDAEIQIHRFDKLLEFYKSFMTLANGNKKLTTEQAAQARTDVMRSALGDMWEERFSKVANIKKDEIGEDLMERIISHLESILGIEADDPLDYRVKRGESVEDARTRDVITKAIIDQLSSAKSLDKVGDTDAGGKATYRRVKRFIASKASGIAAETQSIWGIAKFLDRGNPDGAFTMMVKNHIMPALARAKTMESDFPKDLERNIMLAFKGRPDLLDSNGQIPFTLSTIHTIDGKHFTGGELIGLYLVTGKGSIEKDADGEYKSKTVAKMLKAYPTLTEKMILESRRVATDPYLNGYQQAISKMFKEMWVPLNKAHADLNAGEEIGFMGESFFPLMKDFRDEEVRAPQDLFEFHKDGTNGDPVKAPSHTKARSDTKTSPKMPMLNAWEVLAVYNKHVVNYIAKGKSTKMLVDALSHPDIYRLANEKFADTKLLDAFNEMIHREMSLTGRVNAYEGYDKFFAGLRQRISVANLKTNPGPILKQFSSIFPVMAQLPLSSFPMLAVRIAEAYYRTIVFTTTKRFTSSDATKHGYKSNSEIAWAGDPDFAIFLRDNPIMRRRIIELNSVKVGSAEIPSYLGRGKLTFRQNAADVAGRGPVTLRVTDSGICFAIYKSAMEAEMKLAKVEGLSQEAAETRSRAFANEVIRVSNDPSNFTEMSLMQTSRGEFIKGSMPFAGFAFKNFQLATEKILFPAVLAYTNNDGSELSKVMSGAGAMARNSRVYLWAFVFPALVMSSIARGRPPKDKEEALKDIIGYSFSTLPMIGQYIQGIMGRSDSVIYAALWQDTVTNVTKSVMNMAMPGSDGRDWYDSSKKLAMGLAGITGQPIYPIRLATRVIDYANGKDVGADSTEVLRFMFLGNSDLLQQRKDELEERRKLSLDALRRGDKNFQFIN